MQNQGDDNIQCPYLFRTHWEYADVEQPGWQWVYDFTARLVCPSDPCSMTKCGFHATCKTNNGQVIRYSLLIHINYDLMDVVNYLIC